MPTKEANPVSESPRPLDSGTKALIEAEQILRRCYAKDRPDENYQLPLSTEEKIACRLVGWPVDNPREFRRLYGRLGAERELGKRAGTQAQLAAATKRLDKAQAAAKQSSAIADQIRELQAKLDALQGEVTAAQNDVDSMTQARQKLAEPRNLPVFVASKCELLDAEIRNRPEDREGLERVREELIGTVLTGIVNDPDNWFEHMAIELVEVA